MESGVMRMGSVWWGMGTGVVGNGDGIWCGGGDGGWGLVWLGMGSGVVRNGIWCGGDAMRCGGGGI